MDWLTGSSWPPEAVLAAFGLTGIPVRLSGGQGRSWRVDDAVVKPLDMDPAMLGWQHSLLAGLDGRNDFRVSVPLHSADGSLVVDDWTIWRYEPGHHCERRWLDIVTVGHELHAALETEPEPPLLQGRTDKWSIGDKVAWGDLPASDYQGTKHLAALTRALRPVDGRPQLIHGDLAGNVLFDDNLPPLVIDFSPYWRPPAFASAIVIADALTFEGAGAELVQPLLSDPDFPQHLLRALIYRIVTDQIADPDLWRADPNDPYLPAVELALDLSRRT